MTILVFKSDSVLVASSSWIAHQDGDLTAINAMGVPGWRPEIRLSATMDEFIAMVAEGGKVVDLRKLQR